MVARNLFHFGVDGSDKHWPPQTAEEIIQMGRAILMKLFTTSTLWPLKGMGQFFIKLQRFCFFFERDQTIKKFNVVTIKVDSNKEIALNVTRSLLIACTFLHNSRSTK